MQLTETTPEKAFEVLKAGNRKIKLGNGYIVKWVNLNNQTCYAEKNQTGSTFNNEDVKFYIATPNNKKTVY